MEARPDTALPGSPKSTKSTTSEERGIELASKSLELTSGDQILPVTENHERDDWNYLHGWRFFIAAVALSACLFLANFEITIVSTSLTSIADEFKEFNKVSWIVTSYLLTYTGFLVIWAKLSDIFGRKHTLIVALLIFTIFSGACGASQTLTQLITFRAFQGLGGAGIFALSMVMNFELVPEERYASHTAIVSIAFAMAPLLGPVFGGLINNSGDWRWVFLLNCPAGVVILAGVLILPNDYPHQGRAAYKPLTLKQRMTGKALKRVDFGGFILLLAASFLLVTALQEAGILYPWKSALVVSMLVISGVLWVAFLLWERFITNCAGSCEPVLPWRFFQNRVRLGLFMSTLFLGPPFTVAVIELAQRYQNTNNDTPLGAGIRLLPFAFSSPVGMITGSMLAGRVKVPPLFIACIGSILQIVGFSLLATLPTTLGILNRQYGYEVIAGFGIGANITILTLMTPFIMEKKDQAVAIGAVTQIRTLGGAVGLGIATGVLNSYIKTHLAPILTPVQLAAYLQTTEVAATFPLALRDQVRIVLGEGYTLQMKMLLAFAGAQLLSNLLMWQKRQIKM